LESVHIDPLSYDVKPRGDSQRLDLENAVLMQELMAMKDSGDSPAISLSDLRSLSDSDLAAELTSALRSNLGGASESKKKHQNKLKKLQFR
ncbi:hypothetical protein cypCar_00042143, partial [Cyprinus carpio]